MPEKNVFGVGFRDDIAVKKQGAAVGVFRAELDVVADHQNRHAGRLQRPQNLPENLLELRIQSLCRFVKEQNVRVQKQDFCQRRALLFAAGKIIRMAVQQLCQLAEGNDLCKALGFAFGFW